MPAVKVSFFVIFMACVQQDMVYDSGEKSWYYV